MSCRLGIGIDLFVDPREGEHNIISDDVGLGPWGQTSMKEKHGGNKGSDIRSQIPHRGRQNVVQFHTIIRCAGKAKERFWGPWLGRTSKKHQYVIDGEVIGLPLFVILHPRSVVRMLRGLNPT